MNEPLDILSSDQMRAADLAAIASGTSAFSLMRAAGRGAAQLIGERADKEAGTFRTINRMHGRRVCAFVRISESGESGMGCFRRRARHGFTLVELLVVIVIVGLLATIAIPNLISAHRKARYSRAASDSKTLVTQAILYGNDKGVYPANVAVMRGAGYANMADVDPWSLPWQLSPALLSGARARQRDDVYMYSRGAGASGVYPVPFAPSTGADGSVGFSSIYGSWSGT